MEVMEAKIAHAKAYLFLFGLACGPNSGTCFVESPCFVAGAGEGTDWFSGVKPVI